MYKCAEIMAKFKDCPVVEELGIDDPNNVFECKVGDECCTVDTKPACCTKMDNSEMM